MKKVISTLLGGFLCLILSYSPIYSDDSPIYSDDSPIYSDDSPIYSDDSVTLEPEDRQPIESVIEQPVYGPEEAPEETIEEPKIYTAVELAEKALPAVVAITVFASFLDYNNNPQLGKSGGSGVFISSNGHVLTCAHLFHGVTDSVTIEMKDGWIFAGEVLNISYIKDLALIKIYEENTPFMPISKDNVKIGETVYAVGHPFGLGMNFTSGIVTGGTVSLGTNKDVIWTNVVINPGNSGGPLINSNGELIGINIMIKGTYSIPNWSGNSFSVSSDEINRFLDKFRGL